MIENPVLTSSNSFRVDHREETTSAEMISDVETYIYEFRLRAQRKPYDLSLSFQDGSWRLGDPHRNEPMTTKAHRAILDRTSRGEPTHREEAEFAGLTFLEQQLADATIGDSIIWFSPPGPKEEGYNENYGFGFKGEVVEEAFGKKTVRMSANRIEKASLAQYRLAFRLLTGADFDAKSADDFIRMPVLIKGGLSNEHVDMVLASVFGFIYDEEEAARNDSIYKTRIEHLAVEYSLRYPHMSPAERIAAIHTMENIATEAKKHNGLNLSFQPVSQTLTEARRSYDYEPEKVMGSCPVTQSSNPLEKFSGSNFFAEKDKYGSREFECPNCGKTVTRPKNTLLKACPHCNSSKVSC